MDSSSGATTTFVPCEKHWTGIFRICARAYQLRKLLTVLIAASTIAMVISELHMFGLLVVFNPPDLSL